MELHRYGKFRLVDHLFLFMVMLLMFVLGYMSFYFRVGSFYGVGFIIMGFYILLSIIKPHSERFIVQDNTILIRQGRRNRLITIPEEPTLIVTYSDVLTPIGKRIGEARGAHMLKGRYSITILQKSLLVDVLNSLHRKYVFRYTNSMIEMMYEGRGFIYSFVCNQALLEKLVSGRKCLLIIPASLVDQISLDSIDAYSYIDEGY